MRQQDVPAMWVREFQAQVLVPVFEVMARRWGREAALEALSEGVTEAALQAGRRAAAAAPEGPSLEHFGACLQALARDDALRVTGWKLEGDELVFTVTACAYQTMYADMGLPRDLGYALSCTRDGAFAQGYHPGLSMERSPTLAQGAPACQFRFIWGG